MVRLILPRHQCSCYSAASRLYCHFVLIVWRLRKCWLDLERFCGSMSCGIQVDKRALAHFLPAGGVHHWPPMGPGFTDSPGCTRKELAWVLWLFSLQQLDVSMFCLILWWHRLSGCCRDRGVWEQSNWPKATVLYFIEVLTEFHGQAISLRSPTVSLHALGDGDHLCWWVASSTPCVW